MSVVLDASAIVPLFVAEARSDGVVAFLDQMSAMPTVTDFALGETAAAISRLVRMKELGVDAANDALSGLDEWSIRRAALIDCVSADIGTATLFVRRFALGLRMPDAIHLAVARRLALPLITFDTRVVRAATVLAVAIAGPDCE